MWLILTEPFDPAGPWLSDGLSACTGRLFSLFTSHDISRDARYEHGGTAGMEWFRLHTRDGSVIDSRVVRGVVNLLFSMPPGLSARINPADRTAAVRNFSLPLMRWMHHYAGPVINRPNAQGICGDIRMPSEWAAIAQDAGLRCLPVESAWATFAQLSPRAHMAGQLPLHRVVVIADSVLPLSHAEIHVPSNLARSCRRLAAAAHAPLLGIDLVETERDLWSFVAAHRRPDLKPGGQPLLDAIARALGLGEAEGLKPPHAIVRESERDGRNDLVSTLSALFGHRTRPQAR